MRGLVLVYVFLMVVAFDSGPGNVFLDWMIGEVNGALYDEGGVYAESGCCHEGLLERMLAFEYFKLDPPKSTGRELFDVALVCEWRDMAKEMGISDEDFMATLTELTSRTIVDAYRDNIPEGDKLAKVVINGGGVHNTYMISRITSLVHAYFGSDVEIVKGDDRISNPYLVFDCINFSDAKEAILFGVLGVMCIQGKAYSALPSLTGGSKASVLGKITPGDNFTKLMANSMQ